MEEKQIKIALFGNANQVKKGNYIKELLQKLTDKGIIICIEHQFAQFISKTLQLNINDFQQFISYLEKQANLVISVGGDGTLLRTAAAIGNSITPILGINTGHLGFLADVSPANIDTTIEAFLNGYYTIEERSLLSVESTQNLSVYPYALNEVAILKFDNSALIQVTAEVDGNLLTSYLADGLIICTPTGSTGYSLSVNGPIISPYSKTFCIAPIAPHSLNIRPVIVDDSSVITLKVTSRTQKFLMAIDGRSQVMDETATIVLKKAPYTIRVMKIKHQHFFDTLRDKMGWGADQR